MGPISKGREERGETAGEERGLIIRRGKRGERSEPTYKGRGKGEGLLLRETEGREGWKGRGREFSHKVNVSRIDTGGCQKTSL